MSRGLGKAQREILETLNKYGEFYLAALADGDMGARYKSLNRASFGLQAAGKIGVVRYACGKNKIAVVRPDAVFHPSLSICREVVELNSAKLKSDRQCVIVGG